MSSILKKNTFSSLPLANNVENVGNIQATTLLMGEGGNSKSSQILA